MQPDETGTDARQYGYGYPGPTNDEATAGEALKRAGKSTTARPPRKRTTSTKTTKRTTEAPE